MSAIRCMRVELVVKDKVRRDEIKEMCRTQQRMLNRLWQWWVLTHHQLDSATAIVESLTAYRQWRAADPATRGDKPTPRIDVWGEPRMQVKKKGVHKGQPGRTYDLLDSTSPLSLYRRLAREFPEVNSRTRGLTEAKWRQTLGTRRSGVVALKGWQAILLGWESVPSYSRPQPIPFDRQNGRVWLAPHPTRAGQEQLNIRCRIERDADTGQSDEWTFPAIVKRNTWHVIRRIVSGEYAWRGSSIVFEPRDGKVYALLSYVLPDRTGVALDATRALHVWPGRRTPWIVRIGTRRFRFGGRARHVQAIRARLAQERAGRREHYRWAGSASKGHGRHRAEHAFTKLSSRWKNVQKLYNHEVTIGLVRLAERERCGVIVQHAPAGDRPRFLDPWDWHAVDAMLRYKAAHIAGLVVQSAAAVTTVMDK